MNKSFETDWAALGLNAAMGKTAFDWKRPVFVDKRTPEQIKASAHKSDMLRRYYARKAKEQAERINPETNWATPGDEAMHRKEIRVELARAE